MNRRNGRTDFELVLLTGLALWLSIAVFNNITDSTTNIFHLQNMLNMRLLHNESILGQGLLWRAWPEDAATIVLITVVIMQLMVCILLWRAAIFYLLYRCLMKVTLTEVKNTANKGIMAFLILWFVFLCGGLWFGYWIKQGAIQSVHMTLIIITLSTFIIINLPEGDSL